MKATFTRTVRFSQSETDDIGAFLKRNPFFDFSSLARLAITEFIRNPVLRVNPLVQKNDFPKDRIESRDGLT